MSPCSIKRSRRTKSRRSPAIGRGILIDVAAYKGVPVLTNDYQVNSDDLKGALHRQGTRLEKGDVVLVRTGQARHYHEASQYLHDYAGVSLEAVRWLVDKKEIMPLGADNLSLEAFPSERSDNWVPVHTFLLAERGVMFLEQLHLKELSRDQVYEFAFIGASLKLRGASGAPMRPIALPIGK